MAPKPWPLWKAANEPDRISFDPLLYSVVLRVSENLVPKLSEKGPEYPLDPLFLAPKAAKQGHCEPFRWLLRLQFEAYPDFSDSFIKSFSETRLRIYLVLETYILYGSFLWCYIGQGPRAEA